MSSGFSLPTIVSTIGYSTVGIYVPGTSCAGRVYADWRWNDDEEFVGIWDNRAGFGAYGGASPNLPNCYTLIGQRVLCNSVGGSLRVRIEPQSSPCTLTSVRVYLFP